jgi:hypothetical protein
MTAQEAFASLLSDQVAPALAADGFDGAGGSFQRPVGRNWEVVGFEHKQVADTDHVKVGVQLAVGIDRLRDVGSRQWPEDGPPAWEDCHFGISLGRLLTGRNVWWDIWPDTELAMLGETIVVAVRRYGLPWLEARSSDERLRNTCMAELDSVAWWELRPLRELVEQLGPSEARDKLDAELRRRAADEASGA